MTAWSINNRACTTLWSTLYSTQQISTNFKDSGSLTMSKLLFYNELSSAEQRSHHIAMMADQLDTIFINGRGAKYEVGINHSSAVNGLVAILSNADNTIEELASTADSLYQFWGEPS